MAWLAGADGCRGGWIRCARETETGELRFALIARAAALLVEPPAPECLALDMPIGLPEAGPRACDREARARLGPRRNSVFPAPVRACLSATDHPAASRIAEAIDGRRVSAQTFNLFPKIVEVDAWLRGDPAARARVREVHPELAFAAWNGDRPMEWAKRTAEGHRERRALAEDWLGTGVIERARGDHPKSRVADDDILDAIANLWSAHRIAAGQSVRLPSRPERDGVGLPMEIVF